MENVQKYEKLLRDRLQELTERLDAIEADLEEPADADSEERATEREGDEVLEQLGNTGVLEIGQIKAALKRIAEGTYGICVNCGEDIPPKRLDVVPQAPRCVNCA